ncbi:hypothetical protein P170DRAFT_443531 [Aspergillus steynii IBT 23096]|uniref:Endonuclease/exonuclease/phosphatase domain-containing protein n=1 Tax=Aspergillus steynii IBT 23096 TaxID=1392250 RepID=A0A2I2GSH0_9EURO|nr:uncharacterized protein P170DRAFT_443531 [Aspergillus steynii IBT 23096]PLB55831.1 hypothetical protein P170DRAFT_443531 [Aspergillus steynii IBT 23096]
MSQTPNLDTPIPQPFYHFTNSSWHPATSPTTTTTTTTSTPLQTLRLTTWNIDFRVPYANQRMTKALSYLSTLHDSSHTTPSVIFLQEMVWSDLLLIQQQPWIQERFYITDVSTGNWALGHEYGTTTLIDKRLDVRGVWRVRYSASRMGRDALFVDIGISGFGDGDGRQTGPEDSILRLCNTHLESLVSQPPRRPMQLRLAAQFMRGDGPSVPHAAILAGDLNAFAPEDLTAPEECGLQDAFLVLGGQDGTEESYTWGQQLSEYERGRFGCSRMDKVLFCGGVEVQSLEKIGAGEKIWIEYPQESDSEESSETGEDMWVTDHIGLQAVFRIVR